MPFGIANLRWSGAGHTFPATLPGRLLPALCGAGLASPPDTGFSSREAEWALLREWALTGECDLSGFCAERAFLVGRGVQGRGTLLVSDEPVCPFPAGDFEIEITPHAVGREKITVSLRFDSMQPEGMPREARLGVDGALFLREASQLHIDEWKLIPRLIDGYGVLEARPTVTPYVPGRYVFRYAAMLGDEVLATEEITEKLHAAPASLLHRMVLPVPRLYIPGEENPPVVVRLTVSRAGIVCDDRLLTTGFLPASFADAPPLQLLVRDAPFFLTGAEWGETAFAPLTSDEIDRRIALLEKAHIRCIRADGLMPDAFYDTLDAKGILLWQVLPLETDAAASVIRRVRHRPSLIAYSCRAVYQGFNRPAELSHPVVHALLDEVTRLDGAHPFFGPTPGGPVARPGRDQIGAGVCRDVLGPISYEGPETFYRDMNLDDAMIRTVACPAPAPGAPLSDPALFAHHGVPLPDAAALAEWFDIKPDNPVAGEILRQMQAETVRYAVERARMRAASASGVFVADPFSAPNAPQSTALVDGDAPRPAYYALESALRPVHGCAWLDRSAYYCGTPFEAKICLLTDGPALGPLAVRAALYLPDGGLLSDASYPAPNETAELGLFRATLPDAPCALTLRITVERLGEVIDENDYTVCVALSALCWPLAHAPYAAVRTVQDLLLVNDCGQTALGVYCGAYQDAYHPGWGALLPGEKRALVPELQEKDVRGLNLEPRQVS